MNIRKVLLLFLCILFIFKGAFGSLKKPWEFLKGIKKIVVTVEKLGKDFDGFGVDANRIRTIAELSLRRDGFDIKEFEEGAESITLEDLNTVGLLIKFVLLAPKTEEKTLFYIYNLHLFVVDGILIARYEKEFPHEYFPKAMTTWNTETLGVIFEESIAERDKRISSALSVLLDKFLNDYYKANPKKKDEVNHGDL